MELLHPAAPFPFFIHISLLIFSVFTPFLLRFPHFPLPRPIQLPLPLLLSPFLSPAARGVPLPLAQCLCHQQMDHVKAPLAEPRRQKRRDRHIRHEGFKALDNQILARASHSTPV